MYSALPPKRMNGNKPLLLPNGKKVANLKDFWSWAYSDLISNAERGALAEYIVACALGVNSTERVSWNKYDLVTPEGISIEVKTSGYIQSWYQKRLSSPAFGIRPTYGWDYSTNKYDSKQKRQSDIYVFCVHKHTDKKTANPLLIEQWDFYLMPTAILNEKFNNQKSASLRALIKSGAELCPYENISKRIRELISDK